jgi:predicted transcriptional regulator
MQQLTNAEEQLMEQLWKLESFMKDLLQFSDKTKTTTVATLLRMIDKDFVAYTEFGNSREYYPLVKKTDYFSKHVNGLITNFSTIRPHSSLPSSPKPIYHQRNWKI